MQQGSSQRSVHPERWLFTSLITPKADGLLPEQPSANHPGDKQMEVIDRRKFTSDGEALAQALDNRARELAENGYDAFSPSLSGYQPLFDTVLLRELKLEDEGLIARPDAFAEPTLFGEVIGVGSKDTEALTPGDIVRFLANVGSTIVFSDGRDGHRYLTI